MNTFLVTNIYEKFKELDARLDIVSGKKRKEILVGFELEISKKIERNLICIITDVYFESAILNLKSKHSKDIKDYFTVMSRIEYYERDMPYYTAMLFKQYKSFLKKYERDVKW